MSELDIVEVAKSSRAASTPPPAKLEPAPLLASRTAVAASEDIADIEEVDGGRPSGDVPPHVGRKRGASALSEGLDDRGGEREAVATGSDRAAGLDAQSRSPQSADEGDGEASKAGREGGAAGGGEAAGGESEDEDAELTPDLSSLTVGELTEPWMEEDYLRLLFSQLGAPPVSCWVARDRERQLQGLGIVQLASRRAARRLLRDYPSGLPVFGSLRFLVRTAKAACSVWIGELQGVTAFVTPQLLRYLFRDVAITGTHLPLDEQNRPRGYGFVNFTTGAAAEHVVKTYAGTPLGGGRVHGAAWAASNLLPPSGGAGCAGYGSREAGGAACGEAILSANPDGIGPGVVGCAQTASPTFDARMHAAPGAEATATPQPAPLPSPFANGAWPTSARHGSGGSGGGGGGGDSGSIFGGLGGGAYALAPTPAGAEASLDSLLARAQELHHEAQSVGTAHTPETRLEMAGAAQMLLEATIARLLA